MVIFFNLFSPEAKNKISKINKINKINDHLFYLFSREAKKE